jgi:hypothetical protein
MLAVIGSVAAIDPRSIEAVWFAPLSVLLVP